MGVISIVSLLYILTDRFIQEFDRIALHSEAHVRINAAEKLSNLVHELQRERGLTAGYFADSGEENLHRLERQWSESDLRVEFVTSDKRLSAQDYLADLPMLGRVRKALLDSAISLADTHDYYSGLIAGVLDELSSIAQLSRNSAVKDSLIAHSHLLFAKEYLGQIRELLNNAFTLHEMSRPVLMELSRRKAIFDESLRQFLRDAPDRVRVEYQSVVSRPGKMISGIIDAAYFGTVSMDPQKWFRDATEAIDALKRVEDSSMAWIKEDTEAAIREINSSVTLNFSLMFIVTAMILLLAVSTIKGMLVALERLLSSMRYMISTKDFGSRIPIKSRDEIGMISQSFNELLDIVEKLINEKDILARTDMLTGACNRRRFGELFAHEAEHCQRYHHDLTLIMIDVDNFKQINDNNGHLAGDKVLIQLAELLKSHVRSIDVVARWGGEEFTILLSETGIDDAREVAEKLRVAIEKEEFEGLNNLSCSFGVSLYHRGETLDEFCGRADGALYDAKRQGRNCVCLAEPVILSTDSATA